MVVLGCVYPVFVLVKTTTYQISIFFTGSMAEGARSGVASEVIEWEPLRAGVVNTTREPLSFSVCVCVCVCVCVRVQVDIFSVDLVFYPIHLGSHWCLAVVNNTHHILSYYDSLGGRGRSCLASLRDYLATEHMDKKKRELCLQGWQDVSHEVSIYYNSCHQ